MTAHAYESHKDAQPFDYAADVLKGEPITGTLCRAAAWRP